jgi:hypothetical protein
MSQQFQPISLNRGCSNLPSGRNRSTHTLCAALCSHFYVLCSALFTPYRLTAQ